MCEWFAYTVSADTVHVDVSVGLILNILQMRLIKEINILETTP